MKISKSSLTCLSSQGRITLQIPEYFISFSNNPVKVTDIIDIPDNWIVRLKTEDGIPCTGKESGFLFFSETGWLANKDKLEIAFNKSQYKRGTWTDFQNFAKTTFDKRKKNIAKKISFLNKKIQQLQKLQKII